MTDQTTVDPDQQGVGNIIGAIPPQAGGDDSLATYGAPQSGAGTPVDEGQTNIQPDMNQPGQGAVPQQGQVQSPEIQQEMQDPSQAPQQGQTQAPPKMVSFVRGVDAASPREVKQAEQQVDPQGQMDPNDLHMATIHAASQQDQDKAWSFMQAYRQKYDMAKVVAAVAADGTQQKPADITASTKAANAAMDHIPDGNKVTFTPAPHGVTATVTDPNGKQQVIPQTAQNYRDFLTGPHGSFDYLMQNPVQKALKQRGPAPGTAPNSYPADSGGGQVQIHAVGPGAGPGPSGVRIGSDLAHMKPLNYEPIPPGGWGPDRVTPGGDMIITPNAPIPPGGNGPQPVSPARASMPAGLQPGAAGSQPPGVATAPVGQPSNDPDAGVPQDMRPDRVVPGSQVAAGGPGPAPSTPTPMVRNGRTGQLTPYTPPPEDAGPHSITTVRYGVPSRTDANGQPIPTYTTQQQHEQELQKLKNIPLTQKNNNYQQNILSKEGIAAAKNAANIQIQYMKSHSADENNRRTNLVNTLRTNISATGDPEGEIDKFKGEMAKLGVNPQDILQEAKLPENFQQQIQQSNAPQTTQSEAGDMVMYQGKQYPATKMFYGLPYKFNPKTGSYDKPQ